MKNMNVKNVMRDFKMTEKEIKKKIIKIHSYDEFPYKRMKEVLDAIEKLDFKISFVDNGNIVCEDNKNE